jgi:hypothetical protein
MKIYPISGFIRSARTTDNKRSGRSVYVRRPV